MTNCCTEPDSAKYYSSENKREYRDRFFRYLFGNPDFKYLALSLYNALNHSHYDDPEELIFNTLQDSIFLHMKNDASFVIHNEMHIYEQQSCWNPNMALRELLYYTNILQRDIRDNNPNALFLSKKYMIDHPSFYVFYNGKDPKPQEEYLYLSDSFKNWEGKKYNCDDINIQVRVKMININIKGGNRSLLDSCRPLLEYSQMMEMIRAEKKRLGIDMAIRKAIASVTEDWIICDAVHSAGKELNNMILAEFNEERYRQELIDEGLEKGVKQGLEQGKELGRKEAEKYIAVRLIQQGESDEMIHAVINSVSMAELADLRKELAENPEKYRSCFTP